MPLIILLSFSLAWLGLICYYLFFFLKLGNYKQQAFLSEKTLPISVVICGKNEISNLKRFLPLILNQNYPSFEVLVVADHCTDDSIKFLHELQKSTPHLRAFEFKAPKRSEGKKEALQFGISKAKHEHLLLTDADCAPCSDQWIRKMSEGFMKEKSLVLGVSLYENKKASFLEKFIKMDAIFIAIQYLSYALRGRTYMSVGRNVAYTKTLFNNSQGFQKHLDIASGDDDLFVQQAATSHNTSIVIHPESQTLSLPNDTWKSFINQKVRHLSTGIRYKKSSLVLLGLFQVLILVFYTCFIAGMMGNSYILVLLTMFLIKKLIQAVIFNRIFFKIGVSDKIIPFLFFDIFWVVLLIYINVKKTISPRSKW